MIVVQVWAGSVSSVITLRPDGLIPSWSSLCFSHSVSESLHMLYSLGPNLQILLFPFWSQLETSAKNWREKLEENAIHSNRHGGKGYWKFSSFQDKLQKNGIIGQPPCPSPHPAPNYLSPPGTGQGMFSMSVSLALDPHIHNWTYPIRWGHLWACSSGHSMDLPGQAWHLIKANWTSVSRSVKWV